MDPYKVLVKARMTEKGIDKKDKENVYLFKVTKKATKKDIRLSVEKIFGVSVLSVRTINVLGKPRRRERTTGRTSSYKKAYVKLKDGDTIPIFEGL